MLWQGTYFDNIKDEEDNVFSLVKGDQAVIAEDLLVSKSLFFIFLQTLRARASFDSKLMWTFTRTKIPGLFCGKSWSISS